MSSEKAYVRNEKGTKNLTIKVHDGFCILSEYMLASHFCLRIGTLRLHQHYCSVSDGVTMEVPSSMIEVDRVFQPDIQFGQYFTVFGTSIEGGMTSLSSTLISRENIQKESKECTCKSVVDIIKKLAPSIKLAQDFQKVKSFVSVLELPRTFDGDVLFELPSEPFSTRTRGLESRFDGHVWTDPITTNISLFPGVVRRKYCGGHLKCCNLSCSFLLRCGVSNEEQWQGRLKKVCRVGMETNTVGSLVCRHCRVPPICKDTCSCQMILCFPNEDAGTKYTRCAIHLGHHLHPVGDGMIKKSMDIIKDKVKEHVRKNESLQPKKLQHAITNDLLLEALLVKDIQEGQEMSADEFNDFIDSLSPLNDKKRCVLCFYCRI